MVRRMVGLLLMVGVFVGCGATPTGGGATSSVEARPTKSGTAAITKITLAMPYIPNVQFAHFYTAVEKGYYAAEGLDVSFDYKFETDSIQRVAQGTAQFGLASGDSVLLARSQGLPVVTVATNSQKFATVFFSKAAQNIAKPEDLKGKSVGIPGRFGAAYIGLKALLYATKIAERDLNIQEIGFAQVEALSQDKVQVASGYGNNEPLQLEAQGVKLNVIHVSDFYPLASDGIISSEQLIATKPDVVRSFVRATLKGMQDVIANPDAAFATTLVFVPELNNADAATKKLQRQVLQATLPYWQSDLTAKNGLGYTDTASWQATYTFLRESGQLNTDVDLTKAFSNAYLK